MHDPLTAASDVVRRVAAAGGGGPARDASLPTVRWQERVAVVPEGGPSLPRWHVNRYWSARVATDGAVAITDAEFYVGIARARDAESSPEPLALPKDEGVLRALLQAIRDALESPVAEEVTDA